MTTPKIPEKEQEESLTNLLESIALEQTALAHLTNTEADKIQIITKMMEDGEVAFKEGIKFLRGVSKGLKNSIKQQMLLQFKLKTVLDANEKFENYNGVKDMDSSRLDDCNCDKKKKEERNCAENEDSVKGNIIKNGNFELWQSPEQPKFWHGLNMGVTAAAKTGITAIHLGSIKESKKDLSANLWQQVKVENKSMLKLKFFITSLLVDCKENHPANPHIIVKLLWLDKSCNQLGEGINMSIPANSLPVCQWTFFEELSSPPPSGANSAILSFSAAPGNPIAIDKVSLVSTSY